MDALQCVYAAGHEGPCLYSKDCAVSGERCNHYGFLEHGEGGLAIDLDPGEPEKGEDPCSPPDLS